MKFFKKLHMLVFMTAALCMVVLCSSCFESEDKKESDDDKTALTISVIKLGRVYTAGYSAGVMRAYYWVDGAVQTIAGAENNSRAADVVPTNFGDYVVGVRQVFNDPSYFNRAIIWFNGNGEFLDDVSSFAYCAALHNGKIYVAGWRDPDGSGDRPCVWEVSDSWTLSEGVYMVSSRSIVMHELETAGTSGQARDIYSDGSDIYVCGYYTQDIMDYACYWKNSTRVNLDDGARAESICVHDGSVYVGGKSSSNARYWVDGTGNNITGFPAGSSGDIVYAVAAGEDGLYLAGQYYKGDYTGFSWHSGNLTVSLPPVIGSGFLGSCYYLGFQESWLEGNINNELEWIGGTVRPHGVRMRLY